jgi:hypothetical protein
MYNNIIEKWKHSQKILFISGDRKGCGKSYLAKQISKDFELIDCKEDELKLYDNIGVSVMFGSKKKKLVIYNSNDIQINKINYNCSIKIIIIILNTYHINSLTKIINKHFIINISLTDSQYINILKNYITLSNEKDYINILKMYNYNLNSILHNQYDKIKKITDDVYDNSLLFINSQKTMKYKIDEYYRNPMEYTLIGLHILDNTKQIQLKDKLKQYRSIILSEKTGLNSSIKDEKIFYTLIYPHKIHIANTKLDIKYNRYISKSIIYTNLRKKNKKLDIDEFYKQLCDYRKDLNIQIFKKYIIINKIDKKIIKHMIKLYDKIHGENNLKILKEL